MSAVAWLPLKPLSRILLDPDKASESARSFFRQNSAEAERCWHQEEVMFLSWQLQKQHFFFFSSGGVWRSWWDEGGTPPEPGLDWAHGLTWRERYHWGCGCCIPVSWVYNVKEISHSLWRNVKSIKQCELVWLGYFLIKASFPAISWFLQS